MGTELPPKLSISPMMNPIRLCFFLALPGFAALTLNGCADQSATSVPAETFASPLALSEAGAIVARVDGMPIHEAWLKAVAAGRNLDLNDPAQRSRAIDELVEYATLIKAGGNRPELADDAMRAQIEMNAIVARANAIMAQMGAVEEPDEATLRAEYDEQMQLNGELEYDVSHMLFTNEAVAKEAATDAVKQGGNFAAARSAFKEHARQAEDLGWIKLGQVPAEFAAALRTLQPGQTTAAPVQTSYGWHVIHLRGTRPFTPPPFEQVREGIRRMIIAKANRAAIEALKSQAQVEIVSP